MWGSRTAPSRGMEPTLFAKKYNSNDTLTYYKTKQGTMRQRLTTIEWQLLVKWKGSEESWVQLKDRKESNPVDVAKYYTARGVEDKREFSWWVPHKLHKRDVLVSAVSSRVYKFSHRYGIESPRSVDKERRTDHNNGNTFWVYAIQKKMKNIGVAFTILPSGDKSPPVWTKASGQLVFGVKMDFAQKVRWVKTGHHTPDPTTSSYSGVVPRDNIIIEMTYAALLKLDVTAADIMKY